MRRFVINQRFGAVCCWGPCLLIDVCISRLMCWKSICTIHQIWHTKPPSRPREKNECLISLSTMILITSTTSNYSGTTILLYIHVFIHVCWRFWHIDASRVFFDISFFLSFLVTISNIFVSFVHEIVAMYVWILFAATITSFLYGCCLLFILGIRYFHLITKFNECNNITSVVYITVTESWRSLSWRSLSWRSLCACKVQVRPSVRASWSA